MPTTMRITQIEFEQEPDCCDNSPFQILTLRREDGGSGSYWILSSERWAFDNPSELSQLLDWAVVAADVERQFAERAADAKPE